MRLPTRLSLAGAALHKQYFAKPRLQGLNVWVVSPGGVGTTFLLEYLSRYVTTNDPYDADGLKHWPHPPRFGEGSGIPRLIFVSGNPDIIVESIARRGWLRTQSAKLGSVGGTTRKGDAQRAAFRRAVCAQIEAWKAVKSDQVMLLEYEEIWDLIPKIADHAGIGSPDFVRNFPARKKRDSLAGTTEDRPAGDISA